MRSIQFHFAKPEESSGFLLWQATMAWQRQMNRALEAIGLTHTQFVIMAALGWLLQSGGGVTQKDIAVHSNTDRMMVSKILRNLQKREFVARRESTDDARSKWVNLTPAGHDILHQALRIVEQNDDSFFANLQHNSAFNAELRKLINLT